MTNAKLLTFAILITYKGRNLLRHSSFISITVDSLPGALWFFCPDVHGPCLCGINR